MTATTTTGHEGSGGRRGHSVLRKCMNHALGVVAVTLAISVFTPVPATTAIGSWILLVVIELTAAYGPQSWRPEIQVFMDRWSWPFR